MSSSSVANAAADMLFINVRKYNAALLDACSSSRLGLKVVMTVVVVTIITKMLRAHCWQRSLAHSHSASPIIFFSPAGVHCRLWPQQQQAHPRGTHARTPTAPAPAHRRVQLPNTQTQYFFLYAMTLLQVLQWMKAHADNPRHYVTVARR